MNTRSVVSFFVLGAGLALSGCGHADQIQSVEYYENNDKDRAAMLTRCKQLAADAEKDANCVNARRAAAAIANKTPAGKPAGSVPSADFKRVPVAK